MKIAILPGDGIGHEIIAEAVKVLNALELDLELEYADVGGTAYDKHGHPLPEHTLNLALSADAVLFGAVGDWKYDKLERHLRPEQAILGLRKALGLTPGADAHDRVVSDITGGARHLMDHLLGLGHTRIGFINGVAREGLTAERQAVYREKLATAGIAFDARLFINCGPEMEDGYRATLGLLTGDDPPTAIWTINDLLAVGARRAIYDLGLRIPQDVALAGCDGTALAAQLAPPLTTIEIPAREIGERAARVVLDHIENPGPEPVLHVFETRLIVRSSTDPSV